MNQLYEKRSVKKDGLPKEEGEYHCITNLTDAIGLYWDGNEWSGDLRGEVNDPEIVTHYLVPVSERAVEERATRDLSNAAKFLRSKLPIYDKDHTFDEPAVSYEDIERWLDEYGYECIRRNDADRKTFDKEDSGL